MDEKKIALMVDQLINTTETEIVGRTKVSETRKIFVAMIPTINKMKEEMPRITASALARRITAIMRENGYPKYTISPSKFSKWYKEETGGNFCTDPTKLALLEKARKARESNKEKAMKADQEPKAADPEPEAADPEPEAADPEPQTAEEVIGLEEVASVLIEDEEDDSGLSTPPDPFGGM